MRADVTTCEVDFKVRVEAPSAQPNDPLYPKQWNMAAIKAPGAWSAGQLGGPLGGPQDAVRRPFHLTDTACSAFRGGHDKRVCAAPVLLAWHSVLGASRGREEGGLREARDGAGPQVRVCMVDTGTDVTHPDLQPNLWMNQAEVNGPGATAANGYQNGIDDDGNGALSCQHGCGAPEGCFVPFV